MWSSIINILTGSLITIIGILIQNYIDTKKQKEQNKKEALFLITQLNPELVSLIFKGANNPSNIDYLSLREELEKSNILCLLPPELKKPFKTLYKIHYNPKNYYKKNQDRIYGCLVEISNKLTKYGDDIIG